MLKTLNLILTFILRNVTKLKWLKHEWIKTLMVQNTKVIKSVNVSSRGKALTHGIGLMLTLEQFIAF